MGAIEKFPKRMREPTPAQELPPALLADADRPEHRYLGSRLLELLTSGQLPKAALKDYAVLRWAFQAHANPAMMLSHAAFLQGDLFRYAIAASFIAMAAWTLIPDKLDEDEPLKAPAKMGAFLTTTVAFFIVEMGDKTQLATVALGARFESALIVTLGTTLGMMLANVPAVFLGHEILKRVSLTLVRRIAAGLFLVIGVWMIVQTAGWV